MSIKVDLDRLREAALAQGTTAYLLTTSNDGRPHAVAVQPTWVGDGLVADAGGRTLRNVVAHPLVSLLWPPLDGGGYSLIVDGDSTVDDTRVTVRPTSAVLHRPAPAPSADVTAGACGQDCVPPTEP